MARSSLGLPQLRGARPVQAPVEARWPSAASLRCRCYLSWRSASLLSGPCTSWPAASTTRSSRSRAGCWRSSTGCKTTTTASCRLRYTWLVVWKRSCAWELKSQSMTVHGLRLPVGMLMPSTCRDTGLLQRFQNEYERIYDAHQQRGGDPGKLPKAFEELVTDPEHFGKETAIYVAALVTRARMEVAVAGLLAVEGHGDLALRRLQESAAGLDHDARDFKRRMYALSSVEARGSKREAIVGMAKQVTTMVDHAVKELPPRELVEVKVRVELPAELVAGGT